jgi:hypothetical protein
MGVSEFPFLLFCKSLLGLWTEALSERHGWYVFNASCRTYQTANHAFAAAIFALLLLLELQNFSVHCMEAFLVYFI